MSGQKIAVIGAGIFGCLSAFELVAVARMFVIFERNSKIMLERLLIIKTDCTLGITHVTIIPQGNAWRGLIYSNRPFQIVFQAAL